MLHALEMLGKYTEMPEETKSYYALDMQMSFYSKFKDYVSYANTYKEYADVHGLEGGSLANEYAWNIFENTTDHHAIILALAWMETLCGETEEYNYEDTYASLLYAAGKYEEALLAANHAIEVGELAGADIAATQELIQKIKSKI
jgi:hypothetical protein